MWFHSTEGRAGENSLSKIVFADNPLHGFRKLKKKFRDRVEPPPVYRVFPSYWPITQILQYNQYYCIISDGDLYDHRQGLVIERDTVFMLLIVNSVSLSPK